MRYLKTTKEYTDYVCQSVVYAAESPLSDVSAVAAQVNRRGILSEWLDYFWRYMAFVRSGKAGAV